MQLTDNKEKKTNINKSVIIKFILIFTTLLYLTLILLVPIISVFIKAFSSGLHQYITAIVEPYAVKSIKLTLFVILITVPINTVFGVIAAWTMTKFNFRGRSLLLAVMDLPFAISPVIAGLMFVLVFSTKHGLLGDFLNANSLKVIFSPAGIIIATLFVTLPFVAKEIMPLMEFVGSNEEEAAIMLGASGWQTFFKVTLPNIKWALFYGVILTISRAAGEFGAVSVVSGHIMGYTNTMPLYIEALYNQYHFNDAFAVASILTSIAIFNLIIKNIVEWKVNKVADK